MDDVMKKGYKCEGCGSKTTDEAGTCCGAERKEVCGACGEVPKEGKCACPVA